MPVRIVEEKDIPKSLRIVTPRLMKSKEWKLVLAKMNNGLKPSEMIVLTLSRAEMDRLRIKDMRAAARSIRVFIRQRQMPYVVRGKNTKDGVLVVIRRTLRADPV